LASHSDFQQGNVHTGFIDQHFDTLFPKIEIKEDDICKAALTLICNELEANKSNVSKASDPFSLNCNARLNYSLLRNYNLKSNDKGKVAIKYINMSPMNYLT